MRYLATLLGVALAVVVLASGCTGKDGGGDSTTSASSSMQQRTVAMSELRFEPAEVTVKVGQPVRLTARNTGTADHDLVIAGLPATGVMKGTLRVVE
jgi:plastocyanin